MRRVRLHVVDGDGVDQGFSGRDIGRPLRDLELSYRPVELRANIERVKVERRTLRPLDVEWERGPNDTEWLDVHPSRPSTAADG